jgi:hypothetical protein
MGNIIVASQASHDALAARVTAVESRVAAVESRAAGLETSAVSHDAPLHWLRRNWPTLTAIVAGNAAISALMIHFLR